MNSFKTTASLMLLMSFAGCTAEFGIVGLTKSDTPPTPTTGSAPDNNGQGNTVVICDPFSSPGTGSAEFGLRGFLFSDQSQGSAGQNRATQVSHYVRDEFKVAELELSSLNVPGRRFNTGFPLSNGDFLTVPLNGNPTTLVEWFAFSLQTQLVLKVGADAPGLYQFAIISDDGATIKYRQPGDTNDQILVDNDGLHPQKLKVSNSVLNFQTGSEKYPVTIHYYQGPREHIAIQILMRKVANNQSATLEEPLNGAFGGEYFHDTTTYPQPSVPTQAYNDLLARGWKPLAPENFLLLGEGNRCVNN
jgi:hypothetical protein